MGASRKLGTKETCHPKAAEAAMKWCPGPCGRELPEECFYRNGRGYLGGACKACCRVRAKFEFRRNGKKRAARRRRRERMRYRIDPAYRAAKLASSAASYVLRRAA